MAQPLGEFLSAPLEEPQDVSTSIPKASPVRHLQLVPSVVEAPPIEQQQEEYINGDVMTGVIYAAVRGNFTDLDAIATACPRDPDEATLMPEQSNNPHPYHDHKSLQSYLGYLYI